MTLNREIIKLINIPTIKPMRFWQFNIGARMRTIRYNHIMIAIISALVKYLARVV